MGRISSDLKASFPSPVSPELSHSSPNSQRGRKMSSVKIHVTFTVHWDLDKFKEEAAKVVQITKKSAGNISCDLCKEIGGDSYAIIETWEDEASADVDTAGEHVTNFIKEMGDAITLDIKKFSIC